MKKKNAFSNIPFILVIAFSCIFYGCSSTGSTVATQQVPDLGFTMKPELNGIRIAELAWVAKD